MWRKLYTTCALFSLLLCAATFWWWKSSSPARIDQISFQSSNNQTVRFWASDGNLMYTRTVRTVSQPSNSKQLSWGSLPAKSGETMPQAPKAAWTGFPYSTEPMAAKEGGGIETTVVVPAWLLIGAFSLLPLMWVASRWRRYKIAAAFS